LSYDHNESIWIYYRTNQYQMNYDALDILPLNH